MRFLIKILIKIYRKLYENKGEYFWEYYNRLAYLSKKINDLKIDSPTILDVGGATGNNLLEKFGFNNVKTLDIKNSADIVASVDSIPCDDDEFKIVTALDVFEHVDKEKRVKGLEEIIRVASHAVFLISPFNSFENNKSEEIILKYIKSEFLPDHRRQGLVEFQELIDSARKSNKVSSVKYENIGNLLNWTSQMLAGEIEYSLLYQELYFLENTINYRHGALSIYLK